MFQNLQNLDILNLFLSSLDQMMNQRCKEKPIITVIGAGISGLTAAYLL